MKYTKLTLAGSVGVIALIAIGGSFYTVDEGERAVVLHNREVVGVADPGLHFKAPFIDDARIISTRTQTVEFPEEPVYTADRQSAGVTFSINYAALPGEVEAIYRANGSLEQMESRVLIRQAKEQIKNVFGRFTADVAIRERGRLNAEVAQAISKLGDGRIKIESVQIENINFSDAVEQAAEDRAMAEMSVQKKKQEFERQKIDNQIAVANAKAAADAQVASAQAAATALKLDGEAKATNIKLQGEAEAKAIKAKSDALAQSPNLVELTKAEKWNGALPQTFVPGSAVPFLTIK